MLVITLFIERHIMKQELHQIHRVFIITNFDKKDNILKDLYTIVVRA